MNRLTGILHVHSRFSYDGEHTLEEYAALARRRGYQFIGMSEHSNTLDESTLARHVEECRRVSSPDCVIVPGIEFTCRGNLHLLGFGVTRFLRSTDPAEVADFIRKEGGVAVLAHPKRYHYDLPHDLAEHVHGIEVWNAGYDGRFVPNDRSIDLLDRFRRRNPRLLPFGGQDLHRIREVRHVRMTIRAAEVSEGAIVEALRAGQFEIENGCFRLGAGRHPRTLRLVIATSRVLFEGAKWVRDRIGG